MLREVNDHLLVFGGDADEPRFCTAAVVVVEPDPGGGADIRVAVGGHPPPFVLRATGDAGPIEASGPLVGVIEGATFEEVSLRLDPGDAVVLYTDGVTERHAGPRFFDEEGLAAVLSRCVGFTSAVLAERIETASRAFVEDAPRDDMAIVVLRVPERTATPTTTSTDLPADERAASLARRFVTAALSARGAEHTVDDAVLLTNELVTNALEHGEPPFRVSVGSVDGGVRVAVSDAGTGPLDGVTGEGLTLVASVARRWGTSMPQSGGKAVWFELEG
jgi:anti-sigma regulatory factor (Ser/Thr protein kinase)